MRTILTLNKHYEEACNKRKSTKDIVENEEQIPQNINHQNEEGIITNKILVRKTIETALKQQTQTADSENNE